MKTITSTSSNRRKSFMELDKLYFWTATIKNWIPIFNDERCLNTILNTLVNLSERELISIYGFVIMPNHVHFIVRMNKLNGKEKPIGSFLKYTAHEILNALRADQKTIKKFEVNSKRKKYEIWQNDSLAIELYSKEVTFQKLNYIHNNPLKKSWFLSDRPEVYLFSSANYYTNGINLFTFLRDIRGVW